MRIRDWQEHMRKTFHERDVKRGLPRNFMWMIEEIGELSEAIRFGTPSQIEKEFADCLAWLTTLANVAGVDLEKAIEKYKDGCPTCSESPCVCKGGY